MNQCVGGWVVVYRLNRGGGVGPQEEEGRCLEFVEEVALSFLVLWWMSRVGFCPCTILVSPSKLPWSVRYREKGRHPLVTATPAPPQWASKAAGQGTWPLLPPSVCVFPPIRWLVSLCVSQRFWHGPHAQQWWMVEEKKKQK